MGPGMEGGASGGHRMLAAIVFTDVVGYSVLAGQDEAKAIELFRRDADLIAKTCAEFEGQVLKNTGDGLLMCFASAVQAVNCAIEIQKRLHQQAEGRRKDEVLQHRIGVHLGDVIVQPDDVIGDGVNVANRIQNEARPGGIAMSQTVYDVVRGKVRTEATSLGVRHLKHIVEPITVWAIPPIGIPTQSPYLSTTPAQDAMMGEIASFEEPRQDGTKGVLYAILALVVLLVPLGLWLYLRDTSPKPSTVASGQGKTTPANEQKGPSEKGGEKGKTTEKGEPSKDDKGGEVTPPTPPKSGDESEVEMPTEEEERPLQALLAGDETLREVLAAFRQRYDFEGAVKYLEDQGYTEAPAGKAMRERFAALVQFRRWVESQIAACPESDPLVLPDPARGNTLIWGGPDGTIVLQVRGANRTVSFTDIEPSDIVRITQAAVARNQPGEQRPLIVIRRYVGVFAREYGLPPPILRRP